MKVKNCYRVWAVISLLNACIFAGCQNATVTADTKKNDSCIRCVNPGSAISMLAHQGGTDSLHMQPAVATNATPVMLDTTNWPSKPWPANMVWIPAGTYTMGGIGDEVRKDEFPRHKVRVDGFWMDKTELTIGEFKRFVKATQYITTAEQKPDWEQLKKQLPPGTPKPDDKLLVPGSMVFHMTDGPVSFQDYSQWWSYVPGANWRHPCGTQSDVFSTTAYDNYPVTQVSWFDAVAYCKWAGKRLPTEAEWEWAARGGLHDKPYSWGDDKPSDVNIKANLWQGSFPYINQKKDGYDFTSPVQSYAPNGYGLYDMIGNVWEWCSDWYRYDAYKKDFDKGEVTNPAGPPDSYDPDEPYAAKRVVRGGSFLCNAGYCASYRPSARMKTDPYTGESHTGFRAVMTQAQWAQKIKSKQAAMNK